MLAARLLDQLEDLERTLLDGPLEREPLRGRVDDLVQLAVVLHDELGELEVP